MRPPHPLFYSGLWPRALFRARDSLRRPFFSLSSAASLFFFSWTLFGSILGSQEDPPTLKNQDLGLDVQRILKNQRFRSEDGLESFLGLSWASFGCSWGFLGTPVGPPDRPLTSPQHCFRALEAPEDPPGRGKSAVCPPSTPRLSAKQIHCIFTMDGGALGPPTL